MSDVKPYGPRVCFVDPPADEQRRASGLLVAGGYDLMNRGIVVGVGEEVPLLKPGCVIYLTSKDVELEINGLKFIVYQYIVAWEESE